jgi:hypothetical protein
MGESFEDGEFMRPTIGSIGNFHLTGKCSSPSQTEISPLDAPILDGQLARAAQMLNMRNSA